MFHGIYFISDKSACCIRAQRLRISANELRTKHAIQMTQSDFRIRLLRWKHPAQINCVNAAISSTMNFSVNRQLHQVVSNFVLLQIQMLCSDIELCGNNRIKMDRSTGVI